MKNPKTDTAKFIMKPCMKILVGKAKGLANHTKIFIELSNCQMGKWVDARSYFCFVFTVTCLDKSDFPEMCRE